MRKPPSRSLFRDGAGNLALIAGIMAVICAFVPFVGDFVTIPTGIVAVVSGWVGLGRAVEGDASNGREAVIGAALGGVGLFIVFLTFAASSMCSHDEPGMLEPWTYPDSTAERTET